jgi:hypothetical protein
MTVVASVSNEKRKGWECAKDMRKGQCAKDMPGKAVRRTRWKQKEGGFRQAGREEHEP